MIDARRHRTQEANRADARERLAELITEALVEPKTRAKSRVNRVGKVERLDGDIAISNSICFNKSFNPEKVSHRTPAPHSTTSKAPAGAHWAVSAAGR